MSSTARTELCDIAPVGDELDESTLSGISGGQAPERTGSYTGNACVYDDISI
ncbi:hypothetical protein ABT061_04335 [Streptosporangium sp. NPDC002544]|uniref:hypothetical protein n=1 Tax=Streptosporangium sp. NPDC002544 TaxID=3154538 RepID=UPI00333459C5